METGVLNVGTPVSRSGPARARASRAGPGQDVPRTGRWGLTLTAAVGWF
jgi:hypothetical protein